MKKLGVVLCLCVLMVLPVKAEDLFLIRMDGRVVSLPEFLWHFNRTGGENVNLYLQQFLKYQLKVADAKRMKLDTLPDFCRLSELLRARVLKKHFVNSQLADSYYKELTDKLAGRHVEKEWVKMDVFTFRLSQHASSAEENNAVRVMSDWVKRLKMGSSPTNADLAWAQQQGIVRQQDAKEWIPVNRLLKELLLQQVKLPLGNWSKSFESPLGLHVIRVVERKDHVDDEWYPELERYIEQQATPNPVFDRTAYEAWTKSNRELPTEVQCEMTSAYEGLLAIYWEKYNQTEKHSQQNVSSSQLASYFHKNKSNYRWEYPHFKGAVIHCLNKKAASKIKKKLKKLPMNQWKETLDKLQQEDSTYRGQLECGLFQIGKNPYVDRLAFKCGNFSPHPEFPYTILLGKKLKKGPEDYTDVLTKVTTDYQRQCENDRFSQLFARFNVEINKDVLKTVNSCGNK